MIEKAKRNIFSVPKNLVNPPFSREMGDRDDQDTGPSNLKTVDLQDFWQIKKVAPLDFLCHPSNIVNGLLKHPV